MKYPMKLTLILLVIGLMGVLPSCRKIGDNEIDVPSSAKMENKKSDFYPKTKNIPDHEKGVVLFKLKNNNTLNKVAGRSAERIFTKAMEKSGDGGFYKSRFQDEIKALAELKKNPDVEWATLNYTETTQTTPDDPYWTSGDLWGMLHIGMPQVWQSGNFGNKQVVVGVIDEGIFGHEDLCQNIWRNPHELDNGIDDDGNGYVDDFHGWDWFNGDNQVYPGASHGTHVAGTIAGKGGNQVGVIGVNSNVTLISCKFLESYGYDDNAVKAIDYLIDLKQRHGINIKVTSNSWGGGGYNPALFEAIKRARDADILFVAAAGNHAGNNDLEPNFPCGYDVDNIISVGASDWGNNRASFSCFGSTTVDIFAPGTGIISTVPNTSTHTSTYAYYSGTSMATPHVSGVCALYAGINPEASYIQIKNAVLNAATKLPQLKGLCLGNETGGNFLNASTFIGQTVEHQAPFYECPELNPDRNPPTTPQNFRITAVGFDPRPGAFFGGYYSLTWERSTDDNGVAGYILWENGTPTWFLGGNNYTIAGIDTSIGSIEAWVHAQDTWGNVSGFSNKDTAIWNLAPNPPDTQAPTVPTNLLISNVGETFMTLSWSPSTDNVGVTGYVITWSGGQSTIGATSRTFTGLSQGTTYDFYVQALDAAGNVSANSVTVQGTTLTPTPPDTQAPSVPQGLTTSNITAASITLGWNSSSDNVGVTGYIINWRAVGGTWLELLVTGTSNVFNTLSQGTTYEFNVKARDAAGNLSTSSQTISATTLAPPPTYIINATLSGNSPQTLPTVSLTYTATSTGTITSVRMERKKGGSSYSDVGAASGGVFNDNSAASPGNYTYRLKVTLSNGQVGYSNEKIIQVKKK